MSMDQPSPKTPKIIKRTSESSSAELMWIPEDSLDVLYSQAVILQFKLLGYAVNHARVSGGMFAIKSSGLALNTHKRG